MIFGGARPNLDQHTLQQVQQRARAQRIVRPARSRFRFDLPAGTTALGTAVFPVCYVDEPAVAFGVALLGAGGQLPRITVLVSAWDRRQGLYFGATLVAYVDTAGIDIRVSATFDGQATRLPMVVP